MLQDDNLLISDSLEEVLNSDSNEIAKNDNTVISSTNSASSNDKEILLSKSVFSVLMDLLDIVRFSCSDLYITDGWISQLSSKKNMIFLINLTPILGNISISLNNISFKYDLLSVFRKQNVDVSLVVNENDYVFKDNFTKVYFKRALEKYLEKVKLEKSKVEETIVSTKDTLVFKMTWNKMLLDRLSIYSKTLSTPLIKFTFNDDYSVTCKIQALDNESTTQIDLFSVSDGLEDDSLFNCYATFPAACLLNLTQGNVFEFECKLYSKKDGKKSIVMRLDAKVLVPGTNKSIDVSIFSPSYLIKT